MLDESYPVTNFVNFPKGIFLHIEMPLQIHKFFIIYFTYFQGLHLHVDQVMFTCLKRKPFIIGGREMSSEYPKNLISTQFFLYQYK